MSVVKKAFSLDADLYLQAEAAAREMKMSRSRLVALAVTDFLRRREAKSVLDRLNEVHGDEPSPADVAAERSRLRLYSETLEHEEW